MPEISILKVSLILTGVLIVAVIILKAISILEDLKKIPTRQDLIDQGIHPTIRSKDKEKPDNTKNDKNY
ncbi:hypothetical protein ACFLYZ_02745 [Thermodesulfobacteriota bacterium]